MVISYNWLSEYLPEKIEPEKLSKILTAYRIGSGEYGAIRGSEEVG
jgi:phenylalanyl-tRNA synthetase beta chain